MHDIEQLHDRIRKTRINRGLSQAGLAKLTGVSQPTVANWESGSHTPRKEALNRISEALEVESIWLLSGGSGPTSAASANYLSRPIYHVPIYNWNGERIALQTDTIARFLPYPCPHGQCFGLSESGAHPTNRVYFIDPEIASARQGVTYLCETAGVWTLTKFGDLKPTSTILGRVLVEMLIFDDL